LPYISDYLLEMGNDIAATLTILVNGVQKVCVGMRWYALVRNIRFGDYSLFEK